MASVELPRTSIPLLNGDNKNEVLKLLELAAANGVEEARLKLAELRRETENVAIAKLTQGGAQKNRGAKRVLEEQ